MKAEIPVITVDGPSGSGKGTVCRLLAAALGWHMLDSGALYRLVGLAARNHGVGFDNPAGLEVIAAHLDVQFVAGDASARETRIVLVGEDVSDQLRTEEVGALASQVAAVPVVRAALLLRQRAFCRAPGLVADGRDMGTVVFPGAPLKVFLTAAPEERASRRYKQLIDKGEDVSLPRLVADIRERDARDMEREVAPLRPADDAMLLDTTQMSIEAVLQVLLAEVGRRGIA